jgi:hypothetical protein
MIYIKSYLEIFSDLFSGMEVPLLMAGGFTILIVTVRLKGLSWSSIGSHDASSTTGQQPVIRSLISNDTDRLTHSHLDTPAFNIDGTPMMDGSLDIHGNMYGVTSPSFNVDGSPMFGSLDIHGNPFGVTSTFPHDT